MLRSILKYSIADILYPTYWEKQHSNDVFPSSELFKSSAEGMFRLTFKPE